MWNPVVQVAPTLATASTSLPVVPVLFWTTHETAMVLVAFWAVHPEQTEASLTRSENVKVTVSFFSILPALGPTFAVAMAAGKMAGVVSADAPSFFDVRVMPEAHAMPVPV